MRLWSWIAVLSLTVISLLLDPALTRAQVVDRPAELRRGICASPGDLVATLAHLVLTTGEMPGQTGATPVEQSGTVVQYTIADVLSADYIVLVRRSPAEEEIVACAEVGGAINPDGMKFPLSCATRSQARRPLPAAKFLPKAAAC